MKEVYSNSNFNSINNLSRAQTAKLRKTLIKTLKNVKTKRTNEEYKTNFNKTRPKTASSLFPNMENNNQICLSSMTNNNKNTSHTKFSRPHTSHKNNMKYNQSLKLLERQEYQKAHLNEVQIQNLFTEKLWEKHNKEKNEDYTKKIAYKKLIMRARLLKAMKINIVLKKQQYDEYNEKYSTGNKMLSEKLRYKNKNKKNESDDSYSSSDMSEKKQERPNFNSLKHPEIFSNYEYTSLFKDFHCTPIELIKKIFNPDEQKIIHLDPIFFRLNKEPFNGVQKNLRFNLKDKINEEDQIFQQKKERAKEINKKFYSLRRKKEQKKLDKKNKKQDGSTSGLAISENEKNENDEDNYLFENNEEIKEKKTERKTKSHNNIFIDLKKDKNKKKKKLKIKGNNSLGIKVNKIKNEKNNINLNINTDYNVYLETHLANYNYKKSLDRPITIPIYNGEEKIKDKKKRLTIQELFDMYNERKRSYLEDMSYNRTRNKYKFEKLRIKHHENMENEKKKKESLRKLMLKIEQNYKLYQK